MDIKDLEPLIGRWEIPIDGGEPGEAVFRWALGGAFVERINGDPGTVIGLSLPLLRRLLARLDARLVDLWRLPPAPG